jgi:hypothetical protein
MLFKAAKQLSGQRCARWRTTALPCLLAGVGQSGFCHVQQLQVSTGKTLNCNSPLDVCAGSQDGSQGAKARSTRHYASAHPEVTVYTGPQSPRKAVTLRTLRAKYEKGQPITMVTAYDYPSAVHVSSRDTGAACSVVQLLSSWSSHSSTFTSIYMGRHTPDSS